jgi:hypothetical protein
VAGRRVVNNDAASEIGKQMTDIEAKALALLNEIELERGATPYSKLNRHGGAEALCRAIEQHEAFEQKVSDALYDYFGDEHVECNGRLSRFFIIPAPKPDPLVETLKNMDAVMERLEAFRAALEAAGFEIREKG